jgi:bacillopeptidase F (M6 metalloprotease family)
MKTRTSVAVAALIALLGAPVAAQSPESLAMIEKLRQLQLDRLGNPQIKTDAIPPVRSTADRPHRMLIIPVEYADVGFDRFKGQADAADRNRAYFQDLLFAPNLRAPREHTLTHYYFHQSKGRYIVTGQVLPVIRVSEKSEYYGQPIQNSDGQWRNDVRAETLVEHALKAAYARNPAFPWKDFDVFDPADYDGDGVYDESDGYIDHFVLVYAGKAQSSCQRLFNLDQKFTSNAPADLYERLQPAEKECAQRIWPHRFSITANNGKGPTVEGFANRRGGVALNDALWVYDYNVQSEYTDISTFIHEFGHSIGLPDLYAQQTNNSTASWDAMSSTASPLPQELSAWSRLVLGWLDPCMIIPRVAGGSRVQSVYLKTMNDWSGAAGGRNAQGLCDAAMVILPPKLRRLRMGPLGANNGKQAAYTGQGNDLNHYLSRTFDLRKAAAGPITLELDTWFEIEADWDYLYVEASVDGETYERLMPTDKTNPEDADSVMPSKRGHDGLGTVPGFTGRSGDRNGDGRVESAPGCDVTAARQSAEERVGAGGGPSPCDTPQWVHATFDLSRFRGREVEIRFHYFADMAAVEDGALVDNVSIPAIGFSDAFEAERFDGWKVEGFSLSSGSHDIHVTHFYLLEYRDPYEKFVRATNYDNALAEPGFAFFRNEETGALEALDVRYRSGVLAWYYNGQYLWSQNEPAEFGPGNGFLLLVDANPQEFRVPMVPSRYFKETDGWRRYEFDDAAQASLRRAFLEVMCFQRRPEIYPLDLAPADRAACTQQAPPGERVSWNGRPLLYGFTIANELLPGEARQARKSMGSLYDIRLAKGVVSFRLADRGIRNAHSADAPFSLRPFPNGLQFWSPGANGSMNQVRGESFAAVPTFSDANPSRYLNPHLPFGSANIPSEGLSFQLAEPGTEAPAGSKVKVYFTWDR